MGNVYYGWLEVALEEYRSLRQESIASMQMQQSSLTFGTATVGLVLSAGLSVWDRPFLPEMVFLILIPAFVSLTLLIWAGEVARMFRVGRFIADVESKINGVVGLSVAALAWENWLARPRPDGRTAHSVLRPLYVAVYLLFVLMDLVSVALGVAHVWRAWPRVLVNTTIACEFMVLVGVVYLSLRMTTRVTRQWREITPNPIFRQP